MSNLPIEDALEELEVIRGMHGDDAGRRADRPGRKIQQHHDHDGTHPVKKMLLRQLYLVRRFHPKGQKYSEK